MILLALRSGRENKQGSRVFRAQMRFIVMVGTQVPLVSQAPINLFRLRDLLCEKALQQNPTCFSPRGTALRSD